MRKLLFFALLPLFLMGSSPTLMVFMRPDTCPWCGKFEEEILSKTAFQESVQGKIIIQRSTSLELEDKFNITEVPTLVLLSSEGEEITRLGYIPLSPEGFAEHLLKICAGYIALKPEMENLNNLDSQKLQTLYQKLMAIPCDPWKARVLEAGLAKDAGVFFLLEKYASLKNNHSKKAHEIREQILERDKGARLQIAVIDTEARFTNNQPISSVIKPLTRYIEKFGEQEKEHMWRAHLFLAQYLIRGEQFEEALKHATAALKLAPEMDKQQIEATITYLKEKKV